jgi:magnesium-transporting ATPase (P-type)
MSEIKKKQIRKGIAAVEIALAAVLVIYLIYGVVTKNSNQLIFNILATILVAAAVVLNDIVEPYLTKVFEEMDEFRKEAYKKYVLWDAASWAGLLIFVFTFGSEDSSFMIISVVLYVIATRQKREYKSQLKHYALI